MRNRTALFTACLALAIVSGCSSTGQKTRSQEDRDNGKRVWAGARANVLYNLAKEQYEGANFDKCRTSIDDALKIDPEHLNLRILSAKLAVEQGNLELAERELVLARRLDPKCAEADYLSGVVCQRWQRAQEAHDYYRSASEKQPSELAYLMAQAEMLVSMNRADEALSLLQARVIFYEYSAAIRDAVGQLFVQKGQYPKAVEVLRQASILATDDTTVREHLAMAYFYDKQYREAAETFATLLKDDRYLKRGDLYVALGECQMHMNKPRDARDSYETASQLSPNQTPAWMGLGKAALQVNDLRRAEIALKRALTLDPGSSEANLLIGYARLRQDKLDEALASFRKSSALDATDTVSLCMIGYVLEKQGKADQALPFYAKALKLRPGDDMATKFIAEVRLDR